MSLITKVSNKTPKKNLVVVAAGDHSLHNTWLQDIPEEERSWDLLISFYGDDKTTLTSPYEYLSVRKGLKFQTIYNLWASKELPEFEYIWFSDDDIATKWSDINKLFDYAKHYQFWLAQPSLSQDSFCVYEILRVQPDLQFRYSSYVEAMIPIFSKEAFEKCIPTYDGVQVGWGLDWVWAKLLGYPKDRIAIIDAVQMKHTRELGSSYKLMDAAKEKANTLAKYQVLFEMRIYSYLPKQSTDFINAENKEWGWEERFYPKMLALPQIYQKMNMPSELIVEGYLKAYHYRKTRAEALYYLAKYYREQKNFTQAYQVAEQGVEIPLPSDTYEVEKWIYDYGMLLELLQAAYVLENMEKCKELAPKIQRKLPNIFKHYLRHLFDKLLFWIKS